MIFYCLLSLATALCLDRSSHTLQNAYCIGIDLIHVSPSGKVPRGLTELALMQQHDVFGAVHSIALDGSLSSSKWMANTYPCD
jgi:hypothetical protein